MLAVALVTAVFQFLEILPFAPLSLWWLLLSIPAVVGTPAPRWPVIGAFTLAFANVVVTYWSPVPLEALRMAANFVGLGVAIALALHVAAAGVDRLARPLAWAAPAVIVQSGITVLFFLQPNVEQQYFDWAYAPYFSGAGVKLLFTTGFNNVVFPEKAGGFFINGNTASMFMAMVAWLYFGFGVRMRRKWMMWFAVVPIVGAVATGSKTALLLTGTSVLVVTLLTVVRRSLLAGFVVAMLVPLAGLFTISALSAAEAFTQDTAATVGSRGRIWELAISAIVRHPILGLGYGGWIDIFSKEGGFIGFDERPAHNFLLQAWLDGGIVYLVLIAASALISVAVGLRALRKSRSTPEALGSAAVLMSAMWVFAHGLADNTWIYGDWHSLPFFGVVIATLAMWTRNAPAGESAPEQLDTGEAHAVRRYNLPTNHRISASGMSRVVLSEEAVTSSGQSPWRCGQDCPFDHSPLSLSGWR